jgi:hypothetical protein
MESVIDANNPVRLIDAFVDVVDFEGLGFCPNCRCEQSKK